LIDLKIEKAQRMYPWAVFLVVLDVSVVAPALACAGTGTGVSDFASDVALVDGLELDREKLLLRHD